MSRWDGFLSNALKATRTGRRMSIREAAADAGVSSATYRRAEAGPHLPQGENALDLLSWAGLLTGTEHDKNVLESLATALRADERLTEGDAQYILTIVTTIYDHLIKP